MTRITRSVERDLVDDRRRARRHALELTRRLRSRRRSGEQHGGDGACGGVVVAAGVAHEPLVAAVPPRRRDGMVTGRGLDESPSTGGTFGSIAPYPGGAS